MKESIFILHVTQIKQSNELPAHNIYSDINLSILELNKKANIKK